MLSQKNITAGGSVAGRDLVNTINYNVAITPIGELNRRYLESGPSDTVVQYIDALTHYMQQSASPDVRSLSSKLEAAGRKDLQDYAELLKERIAKRILLYQTSQAAQEILVHLLADINRRFHLRVLSAIASNKTREEVDALIDVHVVEPVLGMLEHNVLGMNAEDLLGMVFFLGGNCHLKWD